MRRGAINAAITQALSHPNCPPLPDWATWGPERWTEKLSSDHTGRYSHIVRSGLGWKATDFGGAMGDSVMISFLLHGPSLDEVGCIKATSMVGCSMKNFHWLNVGQSTPYMVHPGRVTDLSQACPSNGYVCLVAQFSKPTPDWAKLLKDMSVQIFEDGRSRQITAPNTTDGLVSFEGGKSVTVPCGLAYQLTTLHLPGADTYPGAMIVETSIVEETSGVSHHKPDTLYPGLGHPGESTPIEEDEPAQFVLAGEYPSLCPGSRFWAFRHIVSD